jgi:predicted metal-binding protein
VNQDLLDLERAVFLAGYEKAFLLPVTNCSVCDECSGVRARCKEPRWARPAPEAPGIDVYSTARQYGYPIEVLSDYTKTMNRYAFLLIK